MSINSAGFLLFLAVSVTLYYVTPKAKRYFILLLASAFFYISSSVAAAVYLFCTILLTYISSLGLARIHQWEQSMLRSDDTDKKIVKQRSRRNRRLLLSCILVCLFATLAVFKYLPVWLSDVSDILGYFGIPFVFRPLKLLMPLGISFYIFQTAGYLIDVYRGTVQPERNLLRYALFVSWFPQMIQGPINRYGVLHSQLICGNDFSADHIKTGIERMIWGVLKKALIADPLAGVVTLIYDEYTSFDGSVIFLGAVLYCLQLYCDFSGGTDLVRGASRLFGVEMAENFCRPYFARSMDEFWRRWHISLGDWMKDYLFYPLALSVPMGRLGKRCRKRFGVYFGKMVIPCFATVVVFLMVGIWQGPGWANIAYGLWNGGIMSLSMLAAPLFRKWKERLRIPEDAVWFRLFQICRTCFLVVIGRYFSRASGLTQAFGMIGRTITDFHLFSLSAKTFAVFGLTGMEWLRTGIALAVLFSVSVLLEKGIPVRERLAEKPVWLQFLLLFFAVLLTVVFVYLNSDYTAIMYVYENV